MDEFYTDYEEYVKESIRYGKEDLTTAPNSGGALVGGQPVKKREEAVEEVKDIIENEAGKKEERIYDPLAKKAIKPNYEGEDELESTLDNIQDTGNTVTPEDKRNLIPGVKKAQKEIFKKLTDMNTRVKKVEIRKRIEKIEKKMEGIKYGKKA